MIIGEAVSIIIDHRKGSVDENGIYYPINVGYINDDSSLNGRIRVYLLGVYSPLDSYTGEFLGYIKSKGDEDRIVCGNFQEQFSDDQILSQIDFIDKYCTVERPVNI